MNAFCSLLCFFAVFAGTAVAETQQIWSFDFLEAGKLPEKWIPLETNGKGDHAVWEVDGADGLTPGKQVLGLTNNSNRGEMGNLLMIEV
ncbi:MAG: hypothetical protein O3B73_16575, partial [bacterium]|nr:hypothetical protein [bacterium]